MTLLPALQKPQAAAVEHRGYKEMPYISRNAQRPPRSFLVGAAQHKLLEIMHHIGHTVVKVITK